MPPARHRCSRWSPSRLVTGEPGWVVCGDHVRQGDHPAVAQPPTADEARGMAGDAAARPVTDASRTAQRDLPRRGPHGRHRPPVALLAEGAANGSPPLSPLLRVDRSGPHPARSAHARTAGLARGHTGPMGRTAHGRHTRQPDTRTRQTHQTDAPDRNSRQERQTDAAQRTRRTRRTPGDTWHRPGSATPHPAPAGPGTAPRPPGDPLRAALGAPSRYVRQAVRADRRPYRSPYRSPCSTALFAGIVRWPRCLATLMATCIGRLRWPCSTHVPRPRSRAPAIGVFDHLFLARLRERPVIDPAEPLRSGLVPPCAGRAPRLAFTIGLLDQPSRSALRRRARPAASRTQHQADRSGRQHQAHGISPAAPRPTAALPEFAGGVDRDRPRLTPPVAPGRFHLPPGARYPTRTAAIPTPNRQYA